MAGELTLNSTVSLSDDQVSVALEGEMVILSLADGEYYGLNPVAAAVWRQLEKPRRVSEIRDALLQEFEGVSEDRCTRELATLLGELRELKLVRVEGELEVSSQ